MIVAIRALKVARQGGSRARATHAVPGPSAAVVKNWQSAVLRVGGQDLMQPGTVVMDGAKAGKKTRAVPTIDHSPQM